MVSSELRRIGTPVYEGYKKGIQNRLSVVPFEQPPSEYDLADLEQQMSSKFTNLSPAEVAAATSADPALETIGSHSHTITFDWMRGELKRDNGLKEELNFGTAVLPTPDHLNQYLYTYGLMIRSQWENVLSAHVLKTEPLRIIDYGCGQGLAGVLLIDNLGTNFQGLVREVLLVEPSIQALIRADAVYRNLFPKAQITCINSMLDDLKSGQVTASLLDTLHVFSNILDIPGFDQGALFNKSFTNGKHRIIAVSHDRNFNGGSARIRAIEEEIRKKNHSSWLTVHKSTISEFKCGAAGKFEAISWTAELTVKR